MGTAFLYAELELPYVVIVTAPQVFVDAGICEKGEMWLVHKAIYGLREAPRAWADHRDKFLRYLQIVSKGMLHRLEKSITDPSVWIITRRPSSLLAAKLKGYKMPRLVRVLIAQFVGNETVGLVLTYVDDILVMSEKNLGKTVMKLVGDRWKCTKPAVLSEDKQITFCSVRMTAVFGGRDILLDQEAYTIDMIERRKITNANKAPIQPDECASVQSTNLEGMTPKEISKLEVVLEAQSLIGEVNWLANKTRMDIAYAAHRAASLCVKEPERSSKISKGIMRYLKGTCDVGILVMSKEGLKSRKEILEKELDEIPPSIAFDPEAVVVFTDASFGDASYTGFVITIGGTPVVWKACKQKLVSMSTAETEIIAAVEGTQHVQGIMVFIAEVFPEKKWKLILAVDNMAAVSIANPNAGTPWRTRHLRKRAQLIHQMQELLGLVVIHLAGLVQLGDLFTKALGFVRLKLLRRLVSMEALTWCRSQEEDFRNREPELCTTQEPLQNPYGNLKKTRQVGKMLKEKSVRMILSDLSEAGSVEV